MGRDPLELEQRVPYWVHLIILTMTHSDLWTRSIAFLRTQRGISNLPGTRGLIELAVAVWVCVEEWRYPSPSHSILLVIQSLRGPDLVVLEHQ